MKKLMLLGLVLMALTLPNCGKKCEKKDAKKTHKVEKSHKGTSKKSASKKSASKKGTSKKGESAKGSSFKGFGFSKK